MKNIHLDYRPSKYIYCHKGDQSLEVHWKKEIPEEKVDQCLNIVESLVSITPAKNLIIDSIELEDSDFGLNWKIIEHTWKSFFENGGEKIIILNKSDFPISFQKEYKAVLKEYGIPLKIDFRKTQD